MKSVVPQLSLELLLRYCVRIVLFPIMPVFIVCKLAMDLAVVVYDLFQGIIHRSDFLHDPLRKPIDSKTKLDIPRVCSYKSFYLPMRDGTRIAVDVWLPPKAQEGGQVSAIFHQARYYRSARMSQPIHSLRFNKPYNLISQEYFEALLCKGIAVVSMDLRGSGASFGTHKGPWLEEETEDSMEVLNWMLNQPWCNGKLGVWGISYEATAAILSATRCPSIVAVVAMYPFLDMYSDVGFLGGLCLKSFIDSWQSFNDKLDLNRIGGISWLSWLFFDHVSPVPGEEHVLSEAIHGHKLNWRSTSEAPFINYCDDTSPATGLSPSEAGPYVRVGQWIERRRQDPAVAFPSFLVVSGWYDTSASCALRLVEQLRDLTDVSLIIGPWNHAGTQHVRVYPGGRTSFSKFDHPLEVAAYFSRKLDGGEGSTVDQPETYHPLITTPHTVRYFNLQEEAWHTASVFPVPEGSDDERQSVTLYLGMAVNGSVKPVLSPAPFVSEASTTLAVDPSRDIASTGVSRYHAMTQLFDKVSYTMDGRGINRLRYTSAPLTAPLDVSGFPVVSLWVSSSNDDAALFVYLEAVDPRTGKGYYVTEGVLRASNRAEQEPNPDNILHFPNVPAHSFKRRDARFLTPGVPVQVRFHLLPTSFRFKKGQCLRVSIGGADSAHFSPLTISPGSKNVRYSLTLHAGSRFPSQIFLPTPGRNPEFVFPSCGSPAQ